MDDVNRTEKGRFVPGVSGNPAGSKPLSAETKLLRKITREKYVKIVEDLSNLEFQDLKKICNECKDGKVGYDVFTAVVARQLVICAEKGEPDKFEYILNRTIGAPIKEFKINGGSLMELFDEANKQLTKDQDASISSETKE